MPATLAQLIPHRNQASASVFGLTSSALGPQHYLGVGVGYKNRDPKSGFALRFYVRRKLSHRELPSSHFIDGTLWGIPTDVVVVRPFRTYGTVLAPAPLTTVMPGSSIQYQLAGRNGDLGTVACILSDQQGGRYALTANHVLARNGSVLKQPQFQVVDGGEAGPTIPTPQPIGTDVVFAPLFNGGDVDCAMIKATPGVAMKQVFPTALGPITMEPAEAGINDQVLKFGHASGITKGTVADLANIPMSFGPGLGVIRVNDTILIADQAPQAGTVNFAQPGDSGSLVFQKSNGNWVPLGLVMGGPTTDPAGDSNEDYVAICSLKECLAALNSSLPAALRDLSLASPETP
jgi:hypothetical protein